MNTLNLPLILEKYNKQLFDSLKNELMQPFKKDIIEDIKKEIYKLFIDNEKKDDKTNICGFKRTRKRGYCRRHVKGYICPYHLKQFKNNGNISILPDKFSSGTQDLNTELAELNILNNIEVDQTNNCINKNIIYLEKKINKNLPGKNISKFKITVNKIILNIRIKKYLIYNKESLIPIPEGPIDDKNIGDPISGSKKNKKKKKNKNKKGLNASNVQNDNKSTKINKINKDIKVTFIKDTKGKTFARNPFPDDFIIENKYKCKCYTFVNNNGIDKIKLYLVNPKDKKDYKIDIINISDLEDLMLTVYTEETVNKYFNK